MKHLHYFFILLHILLNFSLSQPLYAQLFSDYRIGVRGGLNLSTLNTPEITERTPRIGYQASAFLDLPLNEFVSLQPELQLATRGGINTYNPSTGVDIVNQEGEAEFFLVYLDLCLPAKVTLAKIISLQAGPYLGYLIDQRSSLDGDVADQFANTPGRDDYRPWDAGVLIGIGLDMQDVTIGFRYCRGLTQVAESEMAAQLLGDGRNSSLQGFITILL